MSTDEQRTTQDAQSELTDRLQDTAWMAQRIEVLKKERSYLVDEYVAAFRRAGNLETQLESQRRETERLAALASSWQATAQRLAEAGDAADRRVVELEAQLKDTQATRDGLEAQILKELEDRTFNPTAFEELIAGIESDRDNAIDASDGNGDYYLRTAKRQIETIHAVQDLARHYGLLNEDTANGAE
jgi:chromosome segregation ATPase